MSTPKNRILLFFLLFISNLEAQEEFQHRFYNSYSTTAHKILPYDGAYYVLGGEQSAPDELPLATLSKIDAAGIVQWVLRLEIPSAWNDILVNGNGGLLLIGNTLPNNDQSNALIASATTTGSFSRVYTYDSRYGESLQSVLLNPTFQNPSYPYYATGTINEDLFNLGTENVTIAEVDDRGVINNMYTIGQLRRRELFSQSIVLTNGELLLFGKEENGDVILRTDVPAMRGEGKRFTDGATILDLVAAPDNKFLVAGTTRDGIGQISHLDETLSSNWSYSIPKLSQVTQLWITNENEVYALGLTVIGGLTRTVFLKIRFDTREASIVWARYLDDEFDAATGHFALLPSGKIAFVDSRAQSSSSNGQHDALVSIIDATFESCNMMELELDLNLIALSLESYEVSLSTISPPAQQEVAWQQVQHDISVVCRPITLLSPLGSINCLEENTLFFDWSSAFTYEGTYRLKILPLGTNDAIPIDLAEIGLSFNQTGISQTPFAYPPSAEVFVEGIRYAWQVETDELVNGQIRKSHVQVFDFPISGTCDLTLTGIPDVELCPGDCFTLQAEFSAAAPDRHLIVYADHPNLSSISVGNSPIAPYPISALNTSPLEFPPHLDALTMTTAIDICMTEGAEMPVNFSIYTYQEGSFCADDPLADCCCYGLQEFSVEVADIPDFQSLELTLKDAMGANPIQEVCSGEQVVFSITNLPTTENTSLLWQYSDDNGLNWIDITVPPFVQEQESALFTFPVFPGNEALAVNCSENTAGFVDRAFRAQLEVTKDNTVCTYFTSEYTLKICCPISEANIVLTTDNEEVDLDVGLCEGDALNLMGTLNSEDLFLQSLGDFVHINWFLNGVDLDNDDQIEFDKNIIVETTDICVEAIVTNCAGKTRTFTKCIQVDPEPICGTISLVDPAVGSIIEGDIQVYEVCPDFAGTLEAEGFDPNNCTVHWEYSYDQITWTQLGVSNTRQNTNIIVEGDFTSIFYRVQCFPKSDPSGCDPCLSNIIEIRENVVPPADPIIDCSAVFFCEGANATLSVATFEDDVTYTWFANGVAISNEATLNYPLTKNTCFQYEATNACYTVISEACCVELCEVVAVIRCPFRADNVSDCASLGEPIVLLGSDSQSSCAGNDLSYEWSWTDASGQAQNQNSIAITDTPPLGGTTYTLTVTDNLSGCTDTTSLTIIPCDEQ